MAHRKWKEIKQQPSMLPGPAVPGSFLASFHFLWAILWAIHPIRPVHLHLINREEVDWMSQEKPAARRTVTRLPYQLSRRPRVVVSYLTQRYLLTALLNFEETI